MLEFLHEGENFPKIIVYQDIPQVFCMFSYTPKKHHKSLLEQSFLKIFFIIFFMYLLYNFVC